MGTHVPFLLNRNASSADYMLQVGRMCKDGCVATHCNRLENSPNTRKKSSPSNSLPFMTHNIIPCNVFLAVNSVSRLRRYACFQETGRSIPGNKRPLNIASLAPCSAESIAEEAIKRLEWDWALIFLAFIVTMRSQNNLDVACSSELPASAPTNRAMSQSVDISLYQCPQPLEVIYRISLSFCFCCAVNDVGNLTLYLTMKLPRDPGFFEIGMPRPG